jgi:RNA polymerase sigma-70 factor, ECF subfamily
MGYLTSSEGFSLPRNVAEAWFRRLYAENSRQVLAYALARTGGAEDAVEVVAETFLVAWRRAAEVPHDTEARLWLFGVARRIVANERRGERRRTRLAEALGAELAVALTEQPEADPETRSESRELLRALERLSADDRELLLLAGWEELSSAEIGRVLGISTPAARTRLHRARRRLRRELSEENADGGLNCTESLQLEEA